MTPPTLLWSACALYRWCRSRVRPLASVRRDSHPGKRSGYGGYVTWTDDGRDRGLADEVLALVIDHHRRTDMGDWAEKVAHYGWKAGSRHAEVAAAYATVLAQPGHPSDLQAALDVVNESRATRDGSTAPASRHPSARPAPQAHQPDPHLPRPVRHLIAGCTFEPSRAPSVCSAHTLHPSSHARPQTLGGVGGPPAQFKTHDLGHLCGQDAVPPVDAQLTDRLAWGSWTPGRVSYAGGGRRLMTCAAPSWGLRGDRRPRRAARPQQADPVQRHSGSSSG